MKPEFEETQIETLLKEVRLRPVPERFLEDYESEVYRKISERERRPGTPLPWLVLAGLVLAAAVCVRGGWVRFAPGPAPSPSAPRQAEIPETPPVVTVPDRSAPSTKIDSAKAQPVPATIFSDEGLERDLLLLQMVGEDEEFSEELGLPESDAQMVVQWTASALSGT